MTSPAVRAARLIACVAFATAVGLNVTAAGMVRPRAITDEPLWLQSPAVARRLSLSFRDLVADIYWVRAVVYYGSERLAPGGERKYVRLYPLLDFSTSLDQRFDVAYRLGAIFLSEGYPGGPGRPDQALQLLEKGRRYEPDQWQFAHDMGFVYYWWLRDFSAAAAHFEEAARLPGAPLWLRTMAAVTLAKGGDRDAARQLWTQLLDGSDVDWIKRSAAFHLQQIRALDDLDALTGLIERFAVRAGRPPASWDDLVQAGLLRAVPVDPQEVPYVLQDGVPALSPSSNLLPLPGHEAGR